MILLKQCCEYPFLFLHLLVSSKHEWTTWAACDQIFEVIQKIKDGEDWKVATKRKGGEAALKDQNNEKEDL